MHEILKLALFNIFIVILLVIDLVVLNKKDHEIKFKEASLLAAGWILLALMFNLGVYYKMGSQKALEFFTGFLLEKSLSVDNLFVFILIFSYFKVEPKYQHKILFWGIIGALIMRAIFILTGVALINKFHWLIYVFGAFLVFTGIKMAFRRDEEVHPDKNPVLWLFMKIFPVTHDHEGGHFFVLKDGKMMATFLFVVLIVVETTDVVFAVDSIPAILAISRDPFIIYSSNVFAILGLRALYFALAGMMKMFRYLQYGLSFVLVFVGFKMLISGVYKLHIGWALAIVAGILGISIAFSLLNPEEKKVA